MKIIIWWYLNRYYLMVFIWCYYLVSKSHFGGHVSAEMSIFGICWDEWNQVQDFFLCPLYAGGAACDRMIFLFVYVCFLLSNWFFKSLICFFSFSFMFFFSVSSFCVCFCFASICLSFFYASAQFVPTLKWFPSKIKYFTQQQIV